MKVLGIVAEYNPFHNGHIHHIQEAKNQTGADFVIAVVSGNFTQAGNISIYDKFSKADIAIRNGIDIVIELPTIYAISSASYFAEAAVTLLNMLGVVDIICFGSESCDISLLNNIARKINTNYNEIWNNIRNQNKNISFAKSREIALSDILTKEEIAILNNSNDILGIEYLKALININSKIKASCIKRNDSYKSATYIRDLFKSDNKSSFKEYIPEDSYKLLENNPVLNDKMYEFIRYTILNNKDLLYKIKDISEGLENKIFKSCINANSYESLIFNIKSKRYQMSRIKRLLVNILLDITEEDFKYALNNKIFYAHILKLSPKGKELLPLICRNSKIPIITSILKQESTLDTNILKYLYLDIKAQNIHSILSNNELNKDYTNKI